MIDGEHSIEQEPILTESEKRIRFIEETALRLIHEADPSEAQQILAILVFGSTGRDEAKVHSDLDIFFALADDKRFPKEFINRFVEVIQNKFPNIPRVEIGAKTIFPNSRAARFISHINRKNDRKVPSWKFVYSINDKTRKELNTILLTKYQEHLSRTQ